MRVLLTKLASSANLLNASKHSVDALKCFSTAPKISTENPTLPVNPGNFYTAEHLQLQETVTKIIQKDINPHVDDWEAKGEFPSHELFKILGDAGIFGVCKPVEYGGLGLDFSYSIAVAEAYASCNCAGVPMAIGVQSDMATPALATFGSDELRTKFLTPTIAGDCVVSIGVSEPSAGSDVGGIQTSAVQSGDTLTINGSKMWITNGMKADWICLLANTSQTNGPYYNKSLICVPMDSEGITRTKIHKIGNHSSDTAMIFFENVKVKASNIIGEPGMGFVYQMLQFQNERMWGTASVLNTLERIISETIEYTRNRNAFGQPLLNNQVIHFRLAELETEVEALRALLYRCVSLYVSGEDVTKLASMSKLKSGRLAREVADSCLQYWGGMGYAAESFVSRAFRDLRLLSIGAGADEVMLSIICKYMGILPKVGKTSK